MEPLHMMQIYTLTDKKYYDRITGPVDKFSKKTMEPLCTMQIYTLTDKKYYDRITGPIDKFSKKTSDFSRLQGEIKQHLIKHGMDLIVYLPNTHDAKKMLFIVIEYPRYTMSKVKEYMTTQVVTYDKYDRNNDVSAQDYLLDCLEKSFRHEVEDQASEVMCFPELFMVLVTIVTHDLPQHWEQAKHEMRALMPQKYPGHDIMMLTKEFSKKARPLIAAGQYDHTLTGNLLANILKTEWPDTPKFDLLTLSKHVNDGIIYIWLSSTFGS